MSGAEIAVIGMGYWGKNLVRNFHTLKSLHTICDSAPTRRQVAQSLYPEVNFVTEYASVLSNASVKGVVLATPAVTHFSMAKAAILAGKDVYVEKPLALDVNEGRELLSLAERQRRVLMVGHILLYHPAVIKLKELITAGELGQLRYLYSNRLNMGKIRSEENILWSFAPHDISVMLWLLGEQPIEIKSQGGAYLSHEINDVTMSQFLFPSGARAHIFVSWLHPFKEQRLVVIGSEKMAVFDDTAEDKLVLYPHKVEWINRSPQAIKGEGEVVQLDKAEPLQTECQHFLDRIADRAEPRTSGAEGLRVLEILQACEESAAPERTPSPDTTNKTNYFAHESAIIDAGAQIGDGTKIWHFCHVLSGARLGRGCNLGQNVMIGTDVEIGDNVKIQNNVSIYTGTIIEDDVFLGPSCVLTNVSNPRSQVVRRSLYERTVIRRGATIGANSTIVCGHEIGRYAFIGAGATVTSNVPDYALMLGTPARQAGWMSRHGHPLKTATSENIYICPESGLRYKLNESGILFCIDLDEESPLAPAHAVGHVGYRDLNHPDGHEG